MPLSPASQLVRLSTLGACAFARVITPLRPGPLILRGGRAVASAADAADVKLRSFRKAMGLANGTVSVMDKNAVCFSRVWCVFEIAESILKATASSYSYGESTQAAPPCAFAAVCFRGDTHLCMLLRIKTCTQRSPESCESAMGGLLSG